MQVEKVRASVCMYVCPSGIPQQSLPMRLLHKRFGAKEKEEGGKSYLVFSLFSLLCATFHVCFAWWVKGRKKFSDMLGVPTCIKRKCNISRLATTTTTLLLLLCIEGPPFSPHTDYATTVSRRHHLNPHRVFVFPGLRPFFSLSRSRVSPPNGLSPRSSPPKGEGEARRIFSFAFFRSILFLSFLSFFQ